MDRLPLLCTPTRNQTHNPSLRPFGLRDDRHSNQLSPVLTLKPDPRCQMWGEPDVGGVQRWLKQEGKECHRHS